jgi:hypothetical protein
MVELFERFASRERCDYPQPRTMRRWSRTIALSNTRGRRSVREWMRVSRRDNGRCVIARARAGCVDDDASCRELGDNRDWNSDGRRAAAGAEARAWDLRVMLRAAVPRRVLVRRCRRHAHAVPLMRPVPRARWQDRRRGEYSAEPERPKAREESHPDAAGHGITIHRLASKKTVPRCRRLSRWAGPCQISQFERTSARFGRCSS